MPEELFKSNYPEREDTAHHRRRKQAAGWSKQQPPSNHKEDRLDAGDTLWEAPDNVSMAAVALAISAGGALSSYETTVLLSVEELIEALGKAKSVRYRAPGG